MQLDPLVHATSTDPCALRIRKHLVYCSMIHTAHSTELQARLSIERSIINLIQNHFDERGKRWRVSVTTCLSKLYAIRKILLTIFSSSVDDS